MPGPVWLPEVVGDPPGMRALAAQLRGEADRIAQVADSATGAVGSMTFEGPAATRFRQRVESARSGLRDAAQGLQGVAATLERAAADVEARQAERQRQLERLAREAEAARAAG